MMKKIIISSKLHLWVFFACFAGLEGYEQNGFYESAPQDASYGYEQDGYQESSGGEGSNQDFYRTYFRD